MSAANVPEYVPGLGDACGEAVGRLNVVLILVHEHIGQCGRVPEDPAADTAGYELSAITEQLTTIRDLLLRSLKQDEADRTEDRS